MESRYRARRKSSLGRCLRHAALCGASAALFSITVTSLASASASESADSNVRVLTRDVALGGPGVSDGASLTPYIEDAAVQEALAALNNDRGSAAVEPLRAWLDTNPTSPWRPQARFALGYALFNAHRWDESIDVLTEAARDVPALSDYALYWAASAAEELDRHTEARAWASLVHPDSVYGPRARFLKARAMRALGELDGAIQELEAFIARHPSAWYRGEVELELATAFEDAERWAEAASLYRQVKTVYPDSDVEGAAERGFARVMPKLSEEERSTFSSARTEDLLRRATVLFDRHRNERVIDLLEPLAPSWTAGSDAFCEGLYLIGKSHTKLRQHTRSIPFYDRVIEHCPGDDRLRAIYNAGRGNWNANNDLVAIERFEQLVEEFPNHSYADDALLYIGRIHRGRGEEAQYRAALNRQIEAYPEGDMLKDAIWLLVAESYRNADHDEVVRFIDSVGAATGEDDIYSRGRLAYFRARSLESLSRVAEAKATYQRLIRAHPLGYYALMSFQRLRRLDAEMASLLEAELTTPNEAAEAAAIPEDLLADAGFVRGRVLIRLGQLGLAEDEFDRLKERMRGRRDVERALAGLLSSAGAYHLSYRAPAARIELADGYPSEQTLPDWLLAYPRPFLQHVDRWASERALDPALVYGIMREESAFQPGVESWANARGLMQLMIGTANDMARSSGRGTVSPTQLFNPALNIELGTAFMNFLGTRFEAHPFLIAAGYNGGAGNVNRWLRERGELDLDLWVEEIPYAQTRHYVKRVLKTWWTYRWLYDEDRVVDVAFDLPPPSN